MRINIGAKILVLFFSSLLCISYSNAATTLAEKLEPILNGNLANAHVGILIKDEEGKVLYSHNEKKYFNPASNIKLFTGAAALYRIRLSIRD